MIEEGIKGGRERKTETERQTDKEAENDRERKGA